MIDDNGFVERPVNVKWGSTRDPNSLAGRLRATAENGKAIRMHNRRAFRLSGLLKSQGFRVRSQQQPDGSHIAWCERIEAVTR